MAQIWLVIILMTIVRLKHKNRNLDDIRLLSAAYIRYVEIGISLFSIIINYGTKYAK